MKPTRDHEQQTNKLNLPRMKTILVLTFNGRRQLVVETQTDNGNGGTIQSSQRSKGGTIKHAAAFGGFQKMLLLCQEKLAKCSSSINESEKSI